MKISSAVMKRLDLGTAVETATSASMDRLPSLILHECLQNAKEALAQSVRAEFGNGASAQAEAMTMPKKGFGPRPFHILSPGSQAIYVALIEVLRENLPAPSRGPENWERFELLGVDSPSQHYIVEFDITACYEYIDHSILRDELVLQTGDIDIPPAIIEFLSEVYPRGRGIPQLLQASDTLADCYLSAIERLLHRNGYEVLRYADDFKCVVPDWSTANALIELAADTAREYGLVLSSAKTQVRRVETMLNERKERASFLNAYFQTAADDLTIVNLPGPYDDGGEPEIIDPEDLETRTAALARIVDEWGNAAHNNLSHHTEFMPLALATLSGDPHGIPDKTLVQYVFEHPHRLENVLRYLQTRKSYDETWKLLAKLVTMERQSAWAKLLLLRTATDLPPPGPLDPKVPNAVEEWSNKQLADRHEVVRVQSCWFRASVGVLTEGELSRAALYASPLTLSALAACAGRAGITGKITNSLCGENRLARLAHAWGVSKR